jgi:hypothetical protein
MARLALAISAVILLGVAPAGAQSLGTFRWQVAPFGSVITLNVTQQGSIYLLDGFESQCGGNATLPVSGVGVVQANGQVFFGLTTITEQGRGLHTQASISTTGFSGTWRDNANQNGTFVFNPGVTCPGGPRISPIVPDQAPPEPAGDAALLQRLLEQIASLQNRLDRLEPQMTQRPK